MKISYDPAKREAVLAARGLDFDDAGEAFTGFYLTRPDYEHSEDEERFHTLGMIDHDLVLIVWTGREVSAVLSRCGKPMKKRDEITKDYETLLDEKRPQLNDDWFEEADAYVGTKLVRRGRPKSDNPKQAISLRVDADVLEHFRRAGAGWQSRMNAELRKAAGL